MSSAGRSARGRFVVLGAILIGSVLARLAVLWPDRAKPLQDPDNYLPLAHSVAAGEGLSFQGRPTAYRPPLYPLLLAPLTSLPDGALPWAIRSLHLALGAGTVALTALAARRWGLSFGRVALAAGVVALDPVLVAQARAVMTETLAALLIALALALLAGRGSLRSALLGGLALGLASLCRPSLLPVAFLAGLAAALLPPGARKERFARAAVLILATLATLAPWAARNARLFGTPVWTTTHGGYTLALANNPAYYDALLNGPRGAVWSGPGQQAWFESIGRKTVGMSEPEADRVLRAEALHLLAERPIDGLRAALARLGRLWAVAPSAAVYPASLRLATALWSVPLGLALLIGLLRRGLWRWPQVAAPAALLALSAVHTLYWTDLRMRAPIVPAIALVAAAARLPKSGRPVDVTAKKTPDCTFSTS